MSQRKCYPCTACCEGALRSKVIDFYPGKPCAHCTEQGCAIYETRPENPCRLFNCVWLQDESLLPDELRPDLSGAIVLPDKNWKGWPVILAAPTDAKIPDDTLGWLKAYSQRTRTPLLYFENLFRDGKYSGFKKFGFGSPAFVEHVKNSIVDKDIFRF